MEIFKPEVEEYLKNFGVSEKEIFRIKERDLRKMVKETLMKAYKLFDNGKWDEVQGMMSVDFRNWEIHYINFHGRDLHRVIEEIKYIREQIKNFGPEKNNGKTT